MENPNVLHFTGFADICDQYRPKPPEIIADLLLQLAGTNRADHVVDLGCGTGLSTLIWIDRTNIFTGIEPSPDMRGVASQRPEWARSGTRAQFVPAEAHQTGLAEQSVDIVTASQALLKHGYTEAEVGLDRLRETVLQRFGDRTMRWFWCYRIRVGIR